MLGGGAAAAAAVQTVSGVVAKAPAVLACAVAAPGEMNRDLKPHVDAVQEVRWERLAAWAQGGGLPWDAACLR